MAQITFSHQTATGRTLSQLTVADLPEVLSLRELIRLRVREEVARHNAKPRRRFHGLVQPEDAEADAEGYLLRRPRPLRWERQADIALEAFARNGFFVLVGDRQVTDLDELIDLGDAEHIAFVKLVPLVGG